VELVEIDAVQLQAAQAAVAALLQALGPRVARPLAGTGPAKAALGGDHEAVPIRMERLRDQVLAHLRPVRVCGVDQVDAELDNAP
jgi:hypothetical protein